MAQEIRDQNVSPEDVKLLKRALDAVSEDDSDTGGVNDARIQRIQSDVADLRAYTDALEEFLEENGTGEDMIQEFGERLNLRRGLESGQTRSRRRRIQPRRLRQGRRAFRRSRERRRAA